MKKRKSQLNRSNAEDSLKYRISELLSAIFILRKRPDIYDICFRIYYPDEDINLYRSSLEEEAKKYGYNIYFKSGKTGTTLGILKDAALEYWK